MILVRVHANHRLEAVRKTETVNAALNSLRWRTAIRAHPKEFRRLVAMSKPSERTVLYDVVYRMGDASLRNMNPTELGPLIEGALRDHGVEGEIEWAD